MTLLLNLNNIRESKQKELQYRKGNFIFNKIIF